MTRFASRLADLPTDRRAQRVAVFFKQRGIPQNNPLWADAVRLGRPPAAYVAERDPVGKGGSKYRGREIKQYPQPSLR